MLGSSQSIAAPNIVLNTIMAEQLCQFADILEKAEDFDKTLQKLVCDTFTEHKRIIFNGNGYSQQWHEEASKRGLSNLPCTAKALPEYVSPKNIALVTKHGIYTESEYRARYEIHQEAYCKIIRIEAKTMVDMVMHEILPAALRYSSDLAAGIVNKRNAIGNQLKTLVENDLTVQISENCDLLYQCCQKLNADLKHVPTVNKDAVNYYSDIIVADMLAVRMHADLLEHLTAKSYWPYPIYSDILFY
jgi:glutamine synthetase